MSITVKRIIILALIIIVGFVLGRLAIRFFMNLMLGRPEASVGPGRVN